MCGIGDTWIKNNRPERENEIEAEESRFGLIIFVKNPQLGKVKTRLAQTLGNEKALEAYMYMLAHTRKVALESGSRNFLFYSEFVDENDPWSTSRFEKSVQVPGNLGMKMAAAFATVLAKPGIDRALIIGSDCLDLKAEHVITAFASLEHNDFAIGPAEDGGYYLLGMKKPVQTIFESKNWSTASVLPDTLADISGMGASVHLLETLSDVDYEVDLLRAMEKRSKN